ncbi:MAG: hypothetical protein ACI83N_000920 [Hydrogenophaga sp.]|jgi:hypothetical protein
MTMQRTLRAPRNPDLFGRVVAALRVLSGQRASMNALEVLTPDVPAVTSTAPVGPLVTSPRSDQLARDPDAPTHVKYTLRHQGFFCEEEGSQGLTKSTL